MKLQSVQNIYFQQIIKETKNLEQTVLYHLLQQAKKENKAVELLISPKYDDMELIIEPHHEICNEEHNIISCDGCLIDLNFVVCAVMIPNREERLKRFGRRNNGPL